MLLPNRPKAVIDYKTLYRSDTAMLNVHTSTLLFTICSNQHAYLPWDLKVYYPLYLKVFAHYSHIAGEIPRPLNHSAYRKLHLYTASPLFGPPDCPRKHHLEDTGASDVLERYFSAIKEVMTTRLLIWEWYNFNCLRRRLKRMKLKMLRINNLQLPSGSD